jgi:hypothetical protein
VAIVAGALVLALVVVEHGGRLIAQRVTASELRTAGIQDAQVRIGAAAWRPTLVPALLGGELDRVQVRLRDTSVSGVTIRSADYVLERLTVDPDLSDATVRVRSLGDGWFRLRVTPDAVAEQLGVDAAIERGRLVLGPDREPAKLRVERGQLLVESAFLRREGIAADLLFIDSRVLPCDPEVTVVADLVELSCTGDRLPGLLDSSLGAPVTDVPPPPDLQPPQTLVRTDEDAQDAEAGG